jgi:hypothetical protein
LQLDINLLRALCLLDWQLSLEVDFGHLLQNRKPELLVIAIFIGVKLFIFEQFATELLDILGLAPMFHFG